MSRKKEEEARQQEYQEDISRVKLPRGKQVFGILEQRLGASRMRVRCLDGNIRIPLERVAILVGKKGSVKRQIEKTTNTKLLIDSRDGTVSISGKESLDVYDSRQMIKAIARGF